MIRVIMICILGSKLLFASDAITVDSIFKKNNGFRTVTNLDILSANNSRTFGTYPNIYSFDDGELITESRKIVLGQTILQEYDNTTDIVLNMNIASDRKTYIGNNGLTSKTNNGFENLWLGVNYDLNTIWGEFKPSIMLQTAILQKSYYQQQEKNHSLKSFNLKYTLRNYSDPLVSSIYFSTVQNLKKKIADKEVKSPDIYTIGLSSSLVLNPKVSLNFNFDQSYQTKMKENSVWVNDSTIISTMGFGITYNINENNSFSFSSSIGTSSNAPDSILSFSLWHKF